jgi:hypothetical protein
MLCRHIYNAAIGERREAWRLRGACVASVSATTGSRRNYLVSRTPCQSMLR